MSYEIIQYTGKVYRLKKQLGPFEAGTAVYCFAHVGNTIWLELPSPWAGASQVKLSEEVFKSLV